MKGKFIVITNFTTKIVTVIMVLVILIIITVFRIYKGQERNLSDILIVPQNELKFNNINNDSEEGYAEKSLEKEMVPYNDMPEYFENFKVVGKLEIPKIELSTYILEETSEKSLNVSVSKFYGPNINEVGNVCIVGHHYNRPTMFGKLKNIKEGDTIKITDIFGQYVIYRVYSIYKVNPNEVECLKQETNGEREITLITCTTSAIKRLIVKAVEIYD